MDKATLPLIDMSDNETGCCPRFHPDDWDEKIFTLDHLKFAVASTKSLFHIPLNMGKVMQTAMSTITRANAANKDRYLILSKEQSIWRADHHFLVDKDVPEMDMVELPGNYITKVYEGPYKDEPKWMKAFSAYASEQGYRLDDVYAFYTTCPKCAKHYGKNYIVLFGKIH